MDGPPGLSPARGARLHTLAGRAGRAAVGRRLRLARHLPARGCTDGDGVWVDPVAYGVCLLAPARPEGRVVGAEPLRRQARRVT